MSLAEGRRTQLENRTARQLLQQVGEVEERLMPAALLDVLTSELVEWREGVVWPAATPNHAQLYAADESSRDATGHESFVNHIHPDDYAPASSAAATLGLGLAAVRILSGRLSEQFPTRGFRIILVVQENGEATLRFHLRRPGQILLGGDLDSSGDAILQWDVGGA